MNCDNSPNNTNNPEGYGLCLTINTNTTSHNIYIDKQIQLIQNLDKSKLSKSRILPKNVVDQTKTAKKCWVPV